MLTETANYLKATSQRLNKHGCLEELQGESLLSKTEHGSIAMFFASEPQGTVICTDKAQSGTF